MGEVIDENDLAPHIRYQHTHRPRRAGRARTISGRSRPRAPTPAKALRFTANFLWMCQGYYRHSEGYTPEWKGMADVQGPDRPSAELAGGSGLHGQARRRDRLGRDRGDADSGDRQRLARMSRCCSARRPTSAPGRNAIEIADELRELQVDETWIHEIVRRKILYDQAVFTRKSFEEPEAVKQELLVGGRAYLGPDYDIETHFTPKLPAVAAAHRLHSRWRPVPGRSSRGKASVVTDEIERFTENGHSAEVRQGTRGRHHRHRDRLQPLRARRHRLRHRRQAARSSPIPSPIAA